MFKADKDKNVVHSESKKFKEKQNCSLKVFWKTGAFLMLPSVRNEVYGNCTTLRMTNLKFIYIYFRKALLKISFGTNFVVLSMPRRPDCLLF